MKAEKIILSFVAVLVGLIAAGVAFYFYQSTKAPKIAITPQVTQAPIMPTNTPKDTNTFTIESPKEESVTDKKMVTISGKTLKGTLLTISTEDADQVIKPADNGDFTATQTIPTGTTQITITAQFPDGTEKTLRRTVTSSTETF